ncbi:unnamed protein product, partial [Brenthis ino]
MLYETTSKLEKSAEFTVFLVRYGTLEDRLHLQVTEGPRKMGSDSILSKSEETEIANWHISLADCGFSLKFDNLLNTVQNIMIERGRPNPFINGRPENSKATTHNSTKSPLKTLKKKEFDTTTKIIKHLNKDLTVCGISVEIGLQVIENAKLYQGLNDSVKSNTVCATSAPRIGTQPQPSRYWLSAALTLLVPRAA